jgi:L-threonate 2-dehydrogenase
MLGAMRAGVAAELHAELAASQAALNQRIAREVPRMYPKAYRWVAEMEEIGDFLAADPGAAELYRGAARLYREIADDPAAVALLDRFIAG